GPGDVLDELLHAAILAKVNRPYSRDPKRVLLQNEIDLLRPNLLDKSRTSIALDIGFRPAILITVSAEARTQLADHITLLAFLLIVDAVVDLFQIPIVDKRHQDFQPIQFPRADERILQPAPRAGPLFTRNLALQSGPTHDATT